jgi:hypothetical protein
MFYPVRYGFGLPELVWALRHYLRRIGGREWIVVRGTVQGHEFIKQRSDGWFVLLYSYPYGGNFFSGEWRRYVWLNGQDGAEALARALPVGSSIAVKVNPACPQRSFAEVNRFIR